MIPVTIVTRDLQLFATIASPRVESATDFKLINPESSQKCCLLYLFICSTIHVSRCGLGGLESGWQETWQLASASNKQGHLTRVRVMLRKKKQNNPFFLLVLERCQIDHRCQTWEFIVKKSSLADVRIVPNDQTVGHDVWDLASHYWADLGPSFGRTWWCSGIPRINLATIRACPRNDDNMWPN